MPVLDKRPSVLLHFNDNTLDNTKDIIPSGTSIVGTTQTLVTVKNHASVANKTFDISGKYIKIVDSNQYDTTKDFTLKFSEYITSIGDKSAIIALSKASVGNCGLLFGHMSGGIRYIRVSNDSITWNEISGYALPTIILNSWTRWEIDYVSSTKTLYLFQEGILINSWILSVGIYYNATYSSYINVWENVATINGQIADFDFIKGTCTHTANFTPADISSKSINKYFSPYLSDIITKYGRSLYLDGNAYLSLPDKPLNTMNDFTIAWDEYFVAGNYTGSLCFNGGAPNTSGALLMYTASGIRYFYASSASGGTVNSGIWDQVSSYTVCTTASIINKWVHWEIGYVDSTKTLYLFQDGVLVNSWVLTARLYYGNSGANYVGLWINKLTAYIEELLILEGECLHTAAYTIPTDPFSFDITNPLTGYGNINKSAIRSIVNNIGYTGTLGVKASTRLANKIGSSILNIFGIRNGNRSGNSLINPIGSTRKILNMVGYNTKNLYGIRKLINNIGHSLGLIKDSSRSIVNYTGYSIGNLITNNISVNDIALLVTPTKTFAGSAMHVVATNKNVLGKYHFLINGIEVTPYQTTNIDISNVVLDIDNTKLSIGDNICKLEYKYANNSMAYVQFKVVKEANDRNLTTENIYWYSGDYKISGNLEIIGADSDKYKRSVAANGLANINESGWYEYTEDLTNELGIMLLNIDCSDTGILFLVSFDNKATYLSFKNGTWSTVDITNIETIGMTKAELYAITQVQWDLVFKRTKFTIIASLDYTRVNSEIAISSFNVRVGYHEWFNYTLPTDDEYIYSRIIFGGAYGGVLIANIYDRNNINIFSISYPGSSGASYYFNDSIKLLPYNYTVGSEVGVDPPGRGSGVFYGKRRNIQLNSISITLPPNYAPAISNILLSSPTTHTDTTLTFHIKDNEGDISYYKIDVNGVNLIQYTTQNLSEYDVSILITSQFTSVGTNAITITTTDLLRTSTPQTIYLTKTDKAPTILTSLFNYCVLNTVISDDDNDSISYRLTLNNIIKIDWTQLTIGPVNINYKCDINDIIIGKQNTLFIEAKDSLGVISSSEIDFVGSYFGLLFQDQNKNSYSNNLGKIIKKLDFGTIVCGSTTKTHDIVIANNTIDDLQNLEINAIDESGYKVQLSDSNNPFTSLEKVNISQINSGDSKTIYTRLVSEKLSNGIKNTNINVKADKKD